MTKIEKQKKKNNRALHLTRERKEGGKRLWRQSNYYTPSRTMLCGRGHSVAHQNRRWKIRFSYQVTSHVHA